jgi:hypothetical protein
MKRNFLKAGVVVLMAFMASISFAESSGVDIIRQGLLGAGSGVIGGAVSGGKSEDLWIGALTGAGVNIIGGSLLDMITSSNASGTANRSSVRYPGSVNTSYRYRDSVYRPKKYYKQKKVPVTTITVNEYSPDYLKGYSEGYTKGHDDGYLKGYKEAVKNIMENK